MRFFDISPGDCYINFHGCIAFFLFLERTQKIRIKRTTDGEAAGGGENERPCRLFVCEYVTLGRTRKKSMH